MSQIDDERSTSEDEAPVELLIHGREKRSTAGRQMSALLDAEADDELALLFEEIEDDNEFAVDAAEEGGEEDEMGLDTSSDDDDDQGPNAQADDFEGERQIEKEEKEEKKKKRAREDLRYRITSKKVKIDPTATPKAPTAPAPRPRKKSERVSWIPTPDEGPTRSSSRRQTMHNKELTHARLKDSEEKRVRLIATMEEAAKRKAKHKPKVLTQEERLAEAERVERHNSKSLNRWEEMEKRKAEERRAKIEALQNRRLEGPVISYWSGVATWADGRLTRVGKVTVTPKPDKEEAARKKSKKTDKELKNETEQKTSEAVDEPGTAQAAASIAVSEHPAMSATEPKQEQPSAQPAQPAQPPPADASQDIGMVSGQGHPEPQKENTTVPDAQLSLPATSAPPDPDATLNILKEDQKKDGETQVSDDQPATADNDETIKEPSTEQGTALSPGQGSTAKDAEMRDAEALPKAEEKPSDVAQESVTELSPTAQPPSDPTVPIPASDVPDSTLADGLVQVPAQVESQPTIHVDESNVALAAELPAPLPAVIEHTGRCLTVLENFDDKTAQSRDFSIYFNAKKPPRLTKISSSLCVITSLPSRYRDPDTSLPFANSYAYHEIRHTAAQKYAWSSMLGCYVGPSGIAARGVPARFLDPNAKEESTPKISSTGDEPNPTNQKGNATGPPDDSKPTTTTPASTSAPTAAALPAAVAAPAPAPAPTPTVAGAGDTMDTGN